MVFQELTKVNLDLLQRKSIFKLAIELVKADNQIHRNEVAILDALQDVFHLSQEELDLVHYISLQEAIESIRQVPDNELNHILSFFDRLISIDNDIDFEENLLLSSIKLSLRCDSSKWCGVVSVPDVNAETTSNQIIYLEDGKNSSVHRVFDDEYDFLLITKALGDIGFKFFYLPNVISELEQRWGAFETVDSKYDLLQRSMGYLVPAGDKEKINNLSAALKTLDEGALYQVVLSRYNIAPAQIPSKSFLLLKIRDCFVLDDEDVLRKTVDFLYIDISEEVKKRVLSFVSEFDDKVFQLSYEGYYKILFDYLSFESKTLSHIILDSKWNFCLSDIEQEMIRFESSPQARCFYILLLKYGVSGVAQQTFDGAVTSLQGIKEDKYQTPEGFDIISFETELLRQNDPVSVLIYNTIKIYESLSTKDNQSRSFLKYIISILQHRSSLKNYINTGFGNAVRLANKEQYYVQFNALAKTYFLSINSSLFFHINEDGKHEAITESKLWKSLL